MKCRMCSACSFIPVRNARTLVDAWKTSMQILGCDVRKHGFILQEQSEATKPLGERSKTHRTMPLLGPDTHGPQSPEAAPTRTASAWEAYCAFCCSPSVPPNPPFQRLSSSNTASPGDLLEMQISGFSARPSESEARVAQSSNLFTGLPGDSRTHCSLRIVTISARLPCYLCGN